MSCSKCGGTGYLPFVKAGKVIEDVHLHCSCHPVYGDHPEPERYQPMRVDMYDFPMSDTFRAHSYQYCNQPDPGYIPPEREPEVPPVQVIEHRHSDISKQDFDLLQQTIRKVKYLEGKLTEREQLKPRQPKPIGYKGIK